ncbi:substrate-binding domain-containing protein [Shewanella sp. YIC-542]|uniref:substrate-binding domain-containing protein n=1 Tax=Shewanella mytili TaxID=3377111 RepID=UPI00398E4925
MLKMKQLLGCVVAAGMLLSASAQAQDTKAVKLATTTSTENSGLLGYLLPQFEADTGYQVQVIATGTGKALKLGTQGDVDLVMTHAPNAEAKFVNDGFGVEPRGVMENDFVVLGPKNDPAKIRDSKTAEEAFAKIAKSDVPFVSRGDDSGTHKKELLIWKAANVKPEFAGYRAVGQGMGKTLLMANEMQGYTLSDRGTYIAYKGKLELTVDFDGGSMLANPYQVILINPAKYPELNHKGARAFSDWLVSDKGQQLINGFKVQGQQLFKATYHK